MSFVGLFFFFFKWGFQTTLQIFCRGRPIGSSGLALMKCGLENPEHNTLTSDICRWKQKLQEEKWATWPVALSEPLRWQCSPRTWECFGLESPRVFYWMRDSSANDGHRNLSARVNLQRQSQRVPVLRVQGRPRRFQCDRILTWQRRAPPPSPPSQRCQGMPVYMLFSEVCLPCSLKYLLRVELVNDYL